MFIKRYNAYVPRFTIVRVCVLQVDIEGSDIVYINVMSWARVPTPMSEDQAWSCACSDVYRENKRNLVTVAFHTTIMDKFDWRDPNKILPELLAPQVIQHLTKIKNMKVRAYLIRIWYIPSVGGYFNISILAFSIIL